MYHTRLDVMPGACAVCRSGGSVRLLTGGVWDAPKEKIASILVLVVKARTADGAVVL